MQPFKSGVGLIAVEGATPVVPMKLKINRCPAVDVARHAAARRGRARLRRADPIRRGHGPPAATAALEGVMAGL